MMKRFAFAVSESHLLTAVCFVGLFLAVGPHSKASLLASDDTGSGTDRKAGGNSSQGQVRGAAIIKARPYQVGYRRQTFAFTNQAGEKQSRQLDLWYPTQEQEVQHDYRSQMGFVAEKAPVAPGAHPLLLFSHGFLGMSDQSIFLTEACARAGYIVASINHTDALLNRRIRRIEKPDFGEPKNWTEDKFKDRREDLVVLLDEIFKWNKERDGAWEGRVDIEQIGGMGHSLGGYTVIGLAGGWKSWKDPRFKAIVAMSPYAHPYGVKGQLDQVEVPIMLQGGTLDFGITPFLPPIYKKLPGDKVLLVLNNETHFGWTNLISLGKTTKDVVTAGNAQLMVDYTLAFFDQHLLQSDQSKILKTPNPRLKSYDFDLK